MSMAPWHADQARYEAQNRYTEQDVRNAEACLKCYVPSVLVSVLVWMMLLLAHRLAFNV